MSITELARTLGNIVASFPAGTFGPLQYIHLQRDKIRDLKYHKGNFEGKISLSAKADFYMFPHFSLVGRVLAKVNRDKTEAVIVVPDWSTQYWYLQLMQMTSHKLLYFQPSPRNLIVIHKTSKNHPIQLKLQLMAIRVMLLMQKFEKHL